MFIFIINFRNRIRGLPPAILLLLLFAASSNGLHSNPSGPSGLVNLGGIEESVSVSRTRPVAASIPFEAYGAYIFAPVRINGSEPLWFILDTGKRRTEINEKRAKALRLKLRGATLQISEATLENLNILASSFEKLEAGFGRHVDGIIGYDLFRRFVVEIDYAARTMGLYEPKSYQYNGPERRIPLRIKDDLAFVQCRIELDGRDEVEGEFQLDTGEGGALKLNTPFVKGNKLLEGAGRTLPLRGWDADARGYGSFVGRLKAFRIGVSYAELYRFVVANALRSRGFSGREVLDPTDALRRLDNFVRKRNPQGARPMLEEARRKRWFEFSTLPPAPPTETELRTWVRWRNLDLDPTRHWERVKVPALLIYGEREDRMPVDKCVERIREALQRAGNSRNMIKVVPGADHELMLAPNTGAREQRSVEVSEGRRIAPDYLDTMTGWLREQLGLAR